MIAASIRSCFSRARTLLFPSSIRVSYSTTCLKRLLPEVVDACELSSGAWGVIFKARFTDGSDVAVKVVPEDIAALEVPAFERLREYQNSGRLHTRQKGSLMGVRFTKRDDENRRIAFVMDHHPGETLLEFIARHPKGVSEARARPIVEGMLECVELVHHMRMFHLDLKAEHFIIGEKPGLVLVDFGAAFLYSEKCCSTPMGLVSMNRSHYGTLTYSAPETLQHQCCAGSDMWSVGVLTYALLVGDPPWLQDGTQAQHIRTANFDQTCTRWQELSDVSRQFIEALLRVDPEKRMTYAQCRNHDFLRGTCTS